MTMLFHKAIW